MLPIGLLVFRLMLMTWLFGPILFECRVGLLCIIEWIMAQLLIWSSIVLTFLSESCTRRLKILEVCGSTQSARGLTVDVQVPTKARKMLPVLILR